MAARLMSNPPRSVERWLISIPMACRFISTEHGKGEPVVLVHGFASRADHNWGGEWFMRWPEHYRVDCAGLPRSRQEREAARFGGIRRRDDGRRCDPADGSLGNQAHVDHGLFDGRANRDGAADVASGAFAGSGARRNRSSDRERHRPSIARRSSMRCSPKIFRREGTACAGFPSICGGHWQRPEGVGGVHGVESRGLHGRENRGAENSGAGDDRDRDEGFVGRRSEAAAQTRFPAANW